MKDSARVSKVSEIIPEDYLDEKLIVSHVPMVVDSVRIKFFRTAFKVKNKTRSDDTNNMEKESEHYFNFFLLEIMNTVLDTFETCRDHVAVHQN